MGFPVVASSAVTSGVPTSGISVTLPSGTTTGDLLVLILGSDKAAADTHDIVVQSGTGWTRENIQDGGYVSAAVFWKVADGSDAVTLAVDGASIGESGGVVALRITGHGSDVEVAGTDYLTVDGATSTTPNPPSLSPSWGAVDTLWIAAAAIDNASRTFTADPSGYSGGVEYDGASSSAAVRVRSVTKEANATSEDPGTFTISVAEQWVTFTIAVKPAAGGGVSLAVQSANHGHIADAPTLVQAHAMTPAEASHSHGVESPTLTQANALSPEETVHGHSAESPALSAAGTLDPADAMHAHSAESPTILQSHVLVVLDSAHAHTADNVTLTLGGSLYVADALHGHVVDQPTLTQANAIAPADSTHGHAAESPALTQANSLSPADAKHGHAADQPALDLSVYLSPSEATHAHAADAPTITQANILAVDEALHAHYADSPLLPQDYTIVVSDTLHAHLTASPNLILGTLPLMSGRVYLSRATLRVYRPTKRLNS